MKIKLANIEWHNDNEVENLPTEGIFEVDDHFVKNMVDYGVEQEQVLEDVLYEDLKDIYDVDALGFDIVEVL